MKKFIFPEKEFLSELYRNCQEHPEIADFLQKGEHDVKNVAKKWIIFEEMDCEKLQIGETQEISAEEYGELCLRRGS